MSAINRKELGILLLYSPQRFDETFGAVKPEGSLGLAYIASALRDAGFFVKILDCSVGGDSHTIEESFLNKVPLGNNFIRVGLSVEEIVKQCEDYGIIGITSIFTAQTSMVKEIVSAIKKAYPEKFIFVGGLNARVQKELFLRLGADIVFLSEAEGTVVEICNKISRGDLHFRQVPGIAFQLDWEVVSNPATFVEANLDLLPIPAWDLMPLRKYWDISRPHGGSFSDPGRKDYIAYAPAMTSRGCPFDCFFCHIGQEKKGSEPGNLKQLRLKSIRRVMREIEILKGLGVTHIFLEDDSLLGRKQRALEIFGKISSYGVRLSGVNGINIAHLCSTRDGRRGAVDDEIMEAMAEAGFVKFMLPVESGSQRIIDKYLTGKLNLETHDITGLIRKAKNLGMYVGGNYTFGYPDETEAEMEATFEVAKRHMNEGMDNANFMLVTPFPGTMFYEMARQEGLLLPDIPLEDYDWMRLVVKTAIPEAKLMDMLTNGWRSVNNQDRIKRIQSLASPDLK